MKRIFISRSLSLSSPIRDISNTHFIIDKNLIQFSPLEFEEPRADWIFFYSRNGVKYFFENGNYALYPYLWACMSEGTADELTHYVTDISFIGEGAPENVATSFCDLLGSEEITCFIRADNSLDSIHKRLARGNDYSLPVYRNTPISDIPKEAFDILIFTSPMSVDAWFDQRSYKNEKVISIGFTTANHLNNSHGIKNVIVAEKPSEESIVNCLRSLL